MPRWRPISIIISLVAVFATTAHADESLADLRIRVLLASGQKSVSFRATAPGTIATPKGQASLSAGAYSIKIDTAQPARQRFHLFSKTFLPTERAKADAYIAEWTAKGYQPEIVVYGKRFHAGAQMIDNRSLWVSLARVQSQDEATAFKKKLEASQVWAWIMPETTKPGAGRLLLSGKSATIKTTVPTTIASHAPIEVQGINVGFWKSQTKARTFSGRLEFAIGPDGLIAVYETLSFEDYLCGVLPTEMPSAWPANALRAQAVAARSEVLSNLGGKHHLEGYDFCATEHCRAYGGYSERAASTDEAVRTTRGDVIIAQGRLVPTVFSANCGGWTESNENVWSAPPNPALRGVPDLPAGKRPKTACLESGVLKQWLTSRPPAYCAATQGTFRWTRRFSTKEITELVNRKYPVGTVRAIELGERGVSGRLKSVKVVGSKKTQLVQKELNIRLAFGGLPSAMFIVETSGNKNRPDAFTFHGGGTGHGVGLCQSGANGMAAAGIGYGDIVRHYFPHAEMVRIQ